MISRKGAAFGSLLVLLGCEESREARPQWLVHVGTDAPIPGLGDRLRIDVLDKKGVACPTCSRVFDTSDDETLPLGFGVEPLPDGGPRFVRARLYRAENTDELGEPSAPLLDLLAELPPLSDTVLEVRALLGMSCFGKPADVASLSSCDPTTGLAGSRVVLPPGDGSTLPPTGSFAGGERGCDAPPPEGMVCIPGGVFLMGSRSFVPSGPDFDPLPEQLVKLSPFYLDVGELDVKTARALVAEGVKAPRVASPAEPGCTYTLDPGDNELQSVNCVDRETASLLCTSQGKRLPKEAEWEFAAVGRTGHTPYPWKSAGETTTATICRTAIVARGDPDEPESSRLCVLEIDAEMGPVPGGSPLDITALGVQNLGGNMAEWVADDFAPYEDESCWGSDLSLRENPFCEADDSLGTVRGGSWQSFTDNTHGFFRRSGVTYAYSGSVGVRCAGDVE